ncbi:MAG TPA: hypothetical protein VEK08_00450 [Planctomycetota bacterium]|nr:hypothetical protein [Planctomycetota bacterium]
MASIAALDVSLRANTGALEKGLLSAEFSLKKFQAAATRAQLGQKDFKQSIGVVAQSLGAQGNAAASLAKNMMEMGPSLGLVVGGFEIYNHVQKTAAEHTANMAKHTADYANVLKTVGRLVGKETNPGMFSQDVVSVMDSISGKLQEVHRQFDVANSDWFENGEKMKALTEQANLYRDELTKLARVQEQLAKLDASKLRLDSSMFDLKMSSKGSPIVELEREIDLMKPFVTKLREQLDGLNVGSAEHTKILQAWQSHQLKILQNQEKIAELQAKAAADAQKVIDDNHAKWMKHMEDELEAHKRAQDEMKRAGDALTKSLRTPAEVLEDELKHIENLLNNGDITHETARRAVERAETDFKKSTDPVKREGRAFATNIADVSSVVFGDSSQGKSAEKQQIDETKKANKLLLDIKNIIAGKKQATAV